MKQPTEGIGGRLHTKGPTEYGDAGWGMQETGTGWLALWMRKQSCSCHTGRLSWNGPRVELKLSVDRSDRAKKESIRFPREQPTETAAWATVTRAVISFMIPLDSDSTTTKTSKISRLRQVSGTHRPGAMLMGSALALSRPRGGESTGSRPVGSLTKTSRAMTVEVALPASSAIIHPVPTTRPEIGSIWRSTVVTHGTHQRALGGLPLLRGLPPRFGSVRRPRAGDGTDSVCVPLGCGFGGYLWERASASCALQAASIHHPSRLCLARVRAGGPGTWTGDQTASGFATHGANSNESSFSLDAILAPRSREEFLVEIDYRTNCLHHSSLLYCAL